MESKNARRRACSIAAHTGGWPTTFKVAAVWDPLRGDPRFAVLLKKHRLAD
jgi:hypothetical protein